MVSTRAAGLVGVITFLVPYVSLAQTIHPRLERQLLSSDRDETHLVWVYLADKGDAVARLDEVRGVVRPRALERRVRRGTGRASRFEDIPPVPDYVGAIRERVERVRHVSRWFNAVSVEATAAQVRALERLPFVSGLDVVRRYAMGAPEPMVPTLSSRSVRSDAADSQHAGAAPDYGTSFGQLEQVNVPALHALGLTGKGVVIAVFDTGFKGLRHESVQHVDILVRWDFVNGDPAVGDHGDRGRGDHGGAVLSVIGGYAPGELIGPAYGATFILAKTENTASETPVEEDNWAAAAEWAEAWGADVITSSLGYLVFDPPYPGYSHRDMNGETAITTRAAQMAAERGVVVVTSAGNAGFHAERNTLGAPADGKLVLSIGAVDAFGRRAEFSSVGRTADGRIKPDVMAQGVLVKGMDPDSPDRYVLVDGTSFSCPLTAGVVALLLEAHPEWSVNRVRSALRSTASTASAPTRLMGWGIVNALAALNSRN